MSESLSRLGIATGLTFLLMLLFGLVAQLIQRVSYLTEGRIVDWPAYPSIFLFALGVILTAMLLVRRLWRKISRCR